MFNNQQPDVRSLYQLQSQPQMQIPQLPMPQLTQPPPPVIPSEMQMTPELLSSPSQGEIGPANRWVDEDGRQRSEVLDRDRDRQDDDRPHDDRPQDDRPQDDRPQDERNEDDDEDEFRNQGSRYYDRDDNSRAYDSDDDRTREDQTSDYQQEQSYSRDEEGPSDEESEDADEPEEESAEDANGRSYGSNGPATEDEQSLDSQPPDQNYSDDQEMEPQQDRFAPQRNLQQFNPRPMPRFMAPNRPLNVPNFPSMPPNTAVPSPMDAQTFSRYQLMSPSSALKEHILPKPREEPKPLTNIPNSKLQISQMSTAEAEYYENKAAMEPNFAPPIASKDTIPGKSRRFRVGLGNVLIRLNGKPLEDSSQLRSKIINGQIIQGKGKLIKSKGPVRVKLSHTKDAKHLKIIDIIAPKQFHVYDTKTDEVESKADDMAKAIEQQNKKVEEASQAMEKAINDKGKLVDDKKEEEKFEKASENMDAVGEAADKKLDQKANLVDKLADNANTAMENQAKKVEALGSRADLAEDRASKLVEKIGNKIERKVKDPETSKPRSRMTISYTVPFPHDPPNNQLLESGDHDNEIKSNTEEEKTYPCHPVKTYRGTFQTSIITWTNEQVT
ncbi:hypothetical protein OS493_032381 [Desmophyllum pertusum]|uniref:Uncharacterized protein n=1 Tax=Desmophyllum pertusum TaxID=174260 RepID=A0A9W9YJA8_9CNID|nr:hypothetical protein OS493_032381 [Desmophyllum pertusum]